MLVPGAVFTLVAAGVLGWLAMGLAIWTRRHLAVSLGRPWFGRFVAVQGLLIHPLLLALVYYLAARLGVAAHWAAAPVYGLLFYLYTLSNIGFTARKFHGAETEEQA